MTAVQIRQPGVYFLQPPRIPSSRLPPLDVASFVGFAERGPLNIPVPVEDPTAYREIFGGRLAVARESGGQIVYAYLTDAVTSFFANGGRRCYVVRIAGSEAKATSIQLPGLVSLGQLQAGQSFTQRSGKVLASSPGEWADRLGVGLRLRSTPLPASKFQIRSGMNLDWEASEAPGAIRPGDLLRLTFRGGDRWLLPVTAIKPPPSMESTFILMAESAWQLITTRDLVAARTVLQVRRLTSTQPELLNGLVGTLAPLASQSAEDRIRLELRGEAVRELQVGDKLQLELNHGESYLFPLTSLSPVSRPGSPNLPQVSALAVEMLRVDTSRWWGHSAVSSSPTPQFVKVERLRFDLLLRYGRQSRPTLDELSFNAPHPRFWGDTALLGSSLVERRSSGVDWSAPLQGHQTEINANDRSPADILEPAAVRAARLFREMQRDKRSSVSPDTQPENAALAGLLAPVNDEERLETYLPLGMPSIVSDEDLVGPETKGDNGLKEFNPDLFLDPNLRLQTTSKGLMDEAFDRYYIQEQRLRGLHSLLFVEEAAMIAIPDAVHRKWKQVSDEIPQVVASPPSPPLLDNSRFDECQVVNSPQSVLPLTTSDMKAEEKRSLPVLVDLMDSLESVKSELTLTLHQALIHFCQARRDVVGILTLPQHFDKRHCVAWHSALREKLGLPPRRVVNEDARDRADLSYVSVYHPWLYVSDINASGRMRAVPCDGTICGMIAAREMARQVWVAPANQPLKNVLGLTPSLTVEDWSELFELQFNLTRSEPQDYRVMSAHTLSDDRALLQLSVRRLLIQLRKAALARGMDYTFENNSPQFQEGVRLAMEALLRFMFQRGAFSGENEAQAFRVKTDKSINPLSESNRERFIVEIQVAPSQPMEFITVLLTRAGQDQLFAIEA